MIKRKTSDINLPKYTKKYNNKKYKIKSHIMLNVLGYQYTIDGLKKFQRDNMSSYADGIIGPRTYAYLRLLFYDKCKNNILCKHISLYDTQSIMNKNLYIYDDYGRVKRGDDFSIYNDLPYLDDILN